MIGLQPMHDSAKNLYIELEKLFHEKSKNSSFDSIHCFAWERLTKLGLPVCRKELFQYFPLHRMYSSLNRKRRVNTYVSCIPKFKTSTMSFYNGRPTIGEEAEKIVVLPMADAMRSYRSIITGKCLATLAKENNPFVLLNQSIAEGLFIYIPPNTTIDSPLTLANYVQDSWLSCPFVLVFVGAGSKITLSMNEEFSECKNDFLVSSHFQIHIAEGASVSYYYTHMAKDAAAWIMHSIRAFLQRDSSFSSISLSGGKQTQYQDIAVSLEGENASTDVRGLWALQSNHQAHIKVLISHLSPHTRSYQHFKGVNCDKSQSSFEGKIYVYPEAQKTEAYQLSHQLLLSDSSVANAKPNLEIFADDVKASHGATISKLSREELFYLQTRGLSPKEAMSCLLQGYYREILQLVTVPSVRALGDNLAEQCILTL